MREDGFYRDGVRFLPLVLWGLPEGVSEAEALAAGFDVLAGPGESGLRLVAIEATGEGLAAWAAPFLDDENLVGWVGWDEPLWGGRTVCLWVARARTC